MEKGNKESYFGVLGLEKKLSNAKPHRGPSRSSPLAQDPSRNIYCAIQGFIVLFKSTTIFKMKWGERIRKYFMQHLSSRHSCSPKSILPRFRRCLFFFSHCKVYHCKTHSQWLASKKTGCLNSCSRTKKGLVQSEYVSWESLSKSSSKAQDQVAGRSPQTLPNGHPRAHELAVPSAMNRVRQLTIDLSLSREGNSRRLPDASRGDS